MLASPIPQGVTAESVLTAAQVMTAPQKAAFQTAVSGAGISSGAAYMAVLREPAKPLPVQIYGNSMDAAGVLWQAAAGASSGRLAISKMSAVGGYKTADVLAKIIAEGFAPGVLVCLYGEGTNDASTAVSTATHIANLRTITGLIKAAGIVPVLRLCPPTDSTFQSATHTNWIAEVVFAELQSIPFVDPFARYVDTDGSWVAGTTNGVDLVHPQAAAYNQAGADAWAALAAGVPPYLIPRTNVGQGIVGANVLQLTDSNADNLPDGWSALALTGHTFNARTDYAYPWRGKKASVSVSQSVQGYIYKDNITGFAVGDHVRAVGVLGLSAASNISVQVWVRCVGATYPNDYYMASLGAVTADGYVSADFTVPAGTTKMQIYISMINATSTAAFSGTVNFGCFDIYNFTANTF